MTHNHAGSTLTAGCDACIETVRRDQYRAEAGVMTVEQLVEALAGRDHMHADWKQQILSDELARRPAWAAS